MEPSKINSVKLKHFLCILMEQHLSPKFLTDCLSEAEKRTEGGPFHYPIAVEAQAKELAARL